MWEQPLHNAHEVESSYGKPSWATAVQFRRRCVETVRGPMGGPWISSAEDSATGGAIYQEWQVTVERTRPTVRTWLGGSPGGGP